MMSETGANGSDKSGSRYKVALGSDAEGYRLKEKLALELREDRYQVRDVGGHNTDVGDYPDVAEILARSLSSGEADLAVLVTGSGAGAAVAANKIAGIRAVHCQEPVSARQSRRQLDANLLCLGSRVLGDALAAEIAREWLAASFSGDERHERLLQRIQRLEADFDWEQSTSTDTD